MKIGGKKLTSKNYAYVCLIKGDEKVDLKVGPLPAGWAYKYQDTGLLDYPEPPRKEVKLAGGKIARKAGGGGFEYELDRNDPKYRKALAETNRRVTAIRLRSVLADDDQIEWGVEEPSIEDSNDTWREYADALATEIEEVFTTDEIDEIIKKSDEVACVFDVEKAIESF